MRSCRGTEVLQRRELFAKPLLELEEKKVGLPRTHLPFIFKTSRSASGKMQIHFKFEVNKMLLSLYALR